DKDAIGSPGDLRGEFQLLSGKLAAEDRHYRPLRYVEYHFQLGKLPLECQPGHRHLCFFGDRRSRYPYFMRQGKSLVAENVTADGTLRLFCDNSDTRSDGRKKIESRQRL